MVVVDTSIVYKWISDESTPDNKPILELLNDYLEGGEQLIVPDILYYELANALSSKSALTKDDIKKAWESFIDFKIDMLHPTPVFMDKTIQFSRQYKVSVYDAAYAVLAKEKKCNLFTADAKFVKQVNLPFVKLLS